MPNIQLVNVSGSSAVLRSGGVPVAQLPNGFAGTINFDALVSVYTGTGFNITTNFVPVGTAPTVFNLTNNSGISGSFQLTGTPETGHEVSFTWSDGGTTRQAAIFNAEETRDAEYVNYTLTSIDQFGSFAGFGGYSPRAGASTNYTTNVFGGVHLGDFLPDGLKGVALHPESLSTTDFRTEVEAAGLGFGLV